MKFMGPIAKAFTLSLCIIANTHLAYAQTASILPPAKTTFLDSNGNPLTAGKVDFYIPGTTTRKTTWQDAAETIPNTNPVTLDAAGRALVLGDGSYRQVVKDRNNNLIWDQVTSSAGSGGSGGISVGDGNNVGAIIPWPGFVAPSGYVFAYGQEISRVVYAVFFNVATQAQSVVCTSGSPTLTSVPDTSQLNINTAVEGACLPSGSVIVSKTVNSVTLNNNATVSVTTSARFFPYGNGNGLTTLNVPDLRGRFISGRENMGGANSGRFGNNYLGNSGGAITNALNLTNLPPYAPTGTIANGAITSTFTSTFNQSASNTGVAGSGNFASGSFASQSISGTVTSTQAASTFTGAAQGGTSTPFNIVAPFQTTNFVIKVVPNLIPTNVTVVTSLGGMTGDVTCGANLTCAGSSIAVTGLGSMAYQNSSAVAVTGGAITGMSNPVSPNDVANKAYVDALASGLHILAPSNLATAAILPNSPTYSNGTLGVGATLTAGSNTTLTVDSIAAPLTTVVLVKNQTSAFQNGIYTVTQAGSGSVPWILTRATYFDQAAEMLAGSYTFVTGGSANSGSSYILQNSVTTVGTTASNWSLFAQGNAGVASGGVIISTRAAALTQNLATYTAVTTQGYLTAGDGGGTTYAHSGSLQPCGFQSADGAYWQIVGGTFNWRACGAKGDNTADDTAAIQASISAAQVTGAISFGPPGSYKVTTAINIASSVSIRGAGYESDYIIPVTGSDKATKIIAYDTTVFSVATDHSVFMEMFGIYYPTTPTAIATPAIIIDAGNEAIFHINKESRIRDVYIVSAGIGINVINGAGFTFDHIHMEGYAYAGIRSQDVLVPGSGDSNIVNCTFSSQPAVAHIWVTSGGGLRINNNKINGGGIGVYVNPTEMTQAISPLFITNNSMESNSFNVLFQRPTGKLEQVGNVVITGNELFAINSSIEAQYDLDAPTVPWIDGAIISGNFFYLASSGAAVSLSGIKNANIAGNQFNGPGSTAIIFDPATTSNIGTFGNNKGTGVL